MPRLKSVLGHRVEISRRTVFALTGEIEKRTEYPLVRAMLIIAPSLVAFRGR